MNIKIKVYGLNSSVIYNINKIVVCGMCNWRVIYATLKNYVGINYWFDQCGDGAWYHNKDDPMKMIFFTL